MANVVFRIFSEKLGATTASQFIGNAGEIFYDPAALSLRISDGVSPGGRLLVGSGAAGTVATDIAVTPSGGIQTSTVQAALQELDAEKLALTGGTMTGELVLASTAPVNPLAAVSKSFMETYVANTISSGGVVANNVVFNNTGTTLTSNTIQSAVVELANTKISTSGGALTGPLTSTQTTFANNELVTKSYVESLISTEDTYIDTIAFSTANGTMTFVNTDSTVINVSMDGRYLRTSGGTMTGEIILANTTPTSNSAAASVGYVSTYINNAFANGSITANTIAFSNTASTNISSNTIQGAIAELDAEKVAKAGDTMTGFLTLSADPTANLHAVTKQYVDVKIANTVITANNISYVPTGTIAANNVTAALTELDAEKVAKAGDTMSGFLNLYADPIAPLQAATKAYVDSKVTAGSGAKFLDDLLDVNATVPLDGQVLVYDAALTRYVLQNRVKTTGDTMTGFLTLSADPTATLHAATKGYVDTKVANLVNSAPAALDTLSELATALGNDANFSTTVTNSIAGKVAKAGDTMTGFLTLSADPTSALHAATKQYVDGKIANTSITANNITYTPTGTIAANNVTAALTELDTEKVAKAGDTMTGFLTLSAAPTANLHAATKAYVDGKTYAINDLTDVDTATAAASNGQVLSWNGTNWIPTSLPPGTVDTYTANATINSSGVVTFTKSDNSTYTLDISTAAVLVGGDTMTGLLTLSGAPTANLHAATKEYVDTKTYTLAGLTDTSNVATASNGQVLAYSSTSSKWLPVTLPSSGDVVGPASATSGTLSYFDTTTGKSIAAANGFTFSGNTISAAAGEAFSYYQVITKTSAANGISLTTPTLSWDYSYHKRTITAATTFAFGAPTIAALASNDAWSMTIELNLTSGSVTWPASIKWPGGTAPTLATGKTHLIMLVTSDGGTTVYGSSILNY